MILIICVLVMVALGLLIYSLIPRKSAVHDHVTQLAGIEEFSDAKQIFERIYSEKTKEKMQQQFQEAGWYNVTTGQMAMRTVTYVLVLIAVALFCIGPLHVSGYGKILCLLLPLLGYLLPGQKLSSAIKHRKAAIQNDMPDFIDMLSSSVAAGVALNGALLTSVEVCTGPLGDELRATLADIRLGRSRADALNALSMRVNQIDVSKFVTTVVQSERVGGNISAVLEELAHESRERRLMRAEEIASMLPVKMTLPMVLFLIPALLTVILGPVLVTSFSGGAHF